MAEAVAIASERPFTIGRVLAESLRTLGNHPAPLTGAALIFGIPFAVSSLLGEISLLVLLLVLAAASVLDVAFIVVAGPIIGSVSSSIVVILWGCFSAIVTAIGSHYRRAEKEGIAIHGIAAVFD
jgi:hypothetical protein